MSTHSQDISRGALPLSRRRFGLGTLALAGGLLVTRHGHAATGKGTVVMGIDADPSTLNLGLTTDYTAGDVSAKILEGLVWLDPGDNVKPSLATSWQASADGKRFTFHLR